MVDLTASGDCPHLFRTNMDKDAPNRLRGRRPHPDLVFPYEDAVWFRNLLGVRTIDNTAEVQTELRHMWANDSTLTLVKYVYTVQ